MPKGRYWSRPSVIIYLSSIVVLVATLTFAIFRLDLRMKIVEMVHACDSDVDLAESVPDNVLLSTDMISLHAAARKSASKVSRRSFLLRYFLYLGLGIKFSFILLRSFPYLGLRINFHSFFFFGLFHTWVCASSFHSLSSFSPSGISIFHFHSPNHSVLMFSLYSRIIFAKRNFHLSFVFPIFRCPLTSKIFHHVLITTRSSICISKCPNRLTSPVFSVMLLLLLILPLQSCF